MNVLKDVVLEVAAPVLEPLGFEYEGQPHPSCVRFARSAKAITQFITFVKSNHRPDSVRADFTTSADVIGMQSWRFATGKEMDRWWHYNDRESLVVAVQDLVRIATESGIPWLERQSL